ISKMNVKELNEASINQQSKRILKKYEIPFDESTNLASLVLIWAALDRNLLDTRALDEPMLLITSLLKNPELAMSLMTETDLGDEKIEMELSETLEEAAGQILVEILAEIRARYERQ
ncbi:MAG: hypothetical protein M1398_00425, partial [Deltaproteobacteria bacterium]|nr:hypothetical protein [Deltaproteobacteria bacterium]